MDCLSGGKTIATNDDTDGMCLIGNLLRIDNSARRVRFQEEASRRQKKIGQEREEKLKLAVDYQFLRNQGLNVLQIVSIFPEMRILAMTLKENEDPHDYHMKLIRDYYELRRHGLTNEQIIQLFPAMAVIIDHSLT